MIGDQPSVFLYAAPADELRRIELARLRATTVPTLDALRSLSPAELQIEIVGMLDRRGYTLVTITSTGDLIVTRDDRKLVVACPRPSEPIVRQRAIARLHEAMIQTNAAAGFYVTARGFDPGAITYALGLPITLVDGKRLLASMRQSRAGATPPDHYSAMCKLCGSIVQHRLSLSVSVPCGTGHFVAPTIARAAIFPARNTPASAGRNSSPASRNRRRRRMTPKAYNKRLRLAHAHRAPTKTR